MIRRVLGSKVRLIDSARQVAMEVKLILRNKEMTKAKSSSRGKCRFYVTDDPEGFSRQAVRFFGHRLSQVKRIADV